MDTNKHEMVHKELSYKVIEAALEVHNCLGAGFLEKVYENALMLVLRRNGLSAVQQARLNVFFKDEIVGEYYADILVDDKIILELKCADEISNVHKAQVIN